MFDYNLGHLGSGREVVTHDIEKGFTGTVESYSTIYIYIYDINIYDIYIYMYDIYIYIYIYISMILQPPRIRSYTTMLMGPDHPKLCARGLVFPSLPDSKMFEGKWTGHRY